MKWLLLSGVCICFGSFAWAMGRLFVKPDGMTRPMRRLSFCAFLSLSSLLAAIVISKPTALNTATATTLYVLALCVFWSAVWATRAQPLSFAYSSDAPGHLVRSGPYRWIRHPFYTSYLLAWLAGPIGTNQWWLTGTVLLMGVIYWKSAREEESKFLTSPLRDAYRSYTDVTGRFFPKLLW